MSHICDGCGKEYVGFSAHDFTVEASEIIQDINSLLIILPRVKAHESLVERLLSMKHGLETTRIIQVTHKGG